jgi:hypothetical protein
VRWRSFNILTRTVSTEWPVTEWTAGDPLSGSSEGSVKIALNALDRAAVARLKASTIPESAGMVLSDDMNNVLWCGIIRKRPWTPRSGVVSLTVEEMRGWFYSAVLRTGAAYVNTFGDYVVAATEQQTIARQLALAALQKAAFTPEPGAPLISVPVTTPTVAVNRDFVGRRGDSIGTLLDNLSKRDGATEWWVETTFDSTSTPKALSWTFRQSLERISRTTPIRLESTDRGANVAIAGEWPEDASQNASRVYAVGDGQPPDQPIAVDSDPSLAAGSVLLREVVSGPYSGVVDNATLFANARQERIARQDSSQSVQLVVDSNRVQPSTYSVGDRAYVRIIDEWLDVTVAAARIIDRQLAGGAGKADTATITLNIADASMPDTSTGVDTGGI